MRAKHPQRYGRFTARRVSESPLLLQALSNAADTDGI